MEAVFFVALAVATAVIHHAHGFSSAFASLTAAASSSNSSIYNYLCLFVAAAAAYTTSRTAASCASAALFVPVVAVIFCCVGMGYPSLAGSVAANWISANWERNGERDLWWCGRLFVLLFVWQAALSGVVAACRVLGGGVSRKIAATFGTAASSSSPSAGAGTGAARNEKKLEQQRRQPQPKGRSRIISSTSSDSGGKGPAVEDKNNGAPGWERKTASKVPLAK